ncbi:hypothetical protein TVAG_003280 [Trichomonas vaginalis G3]|uniref:Importin N-terminal domain-containing protein n=1 Tax=Trichomonas vaginalis (strain ATCC PRA-98 / G3) TaxID=412133 RepID=A2FN80_TRIV3|nr:armadillo (ARM) repeat-containing protein family [Trichomonas vaginalis G3]EAX93639.1 hypothetical protein TVAG_003280 [Trichomonas vaginalis G3]KAI5507093.1 armadillo (ARM) repeat-containing protein family [Trichomonas vaginalis G3]|eukprot:XP_001306569.1 hypothetical protein [Trichomonas vaginalis G3]
MDESRFISLIDRCKSEDNEIRSNAESERDQIIQNDPLLFVNSLLQIIVSNNYENLNDYMITLIFSVIKRAQSYLEHESLKIFFGNLHSCIQTLLNRSHSLNIICSTYALTLSNIHKLPEADFDFNGVLIELQTIIQQQFSLSIISEAIENSPDLYNFDIDFLYQIIDQNREYDGIIRYYFSIIGKLEENEKFVEIFPNILEKITIDNVYTSLDAMNAFCELGSPFIGYIYLDLARYICNLAINNKIDQIQANCVFIISAITLKNTKFVVNSPEFVDLVFQLFISLIRDVSYDKLDNDTDNGAFSIIETVASEISEKLEVIIIEKIPEYFQSAQNDAGILYGLLILISLYHPYVKCELSGPKARFNINSDIYTILTTNEDIGLRYACIRYISQLIFSGISVDEIEIFNYFLNLDFQGEDEHCIYWILSFFEQFSFNTRSNENSLEFNTLCKEKMLSVSENLPNEKCVAKLIKILTKNIKITQDPIEDVCEKYAELFNEYKESDFIKVTIISQIQEIFGSYKNKENEQFISEQAVMYYNECNNMLQKDDLPPKYLSYCLAAIFNFLQLAQDQLGDRIFDLYKGCYSILSQPLQYNEETQLNVFDLTAYYVADSFTSSIKYTIDKTMVEMIDDNMRILFEISKKKVFYETVENNIEMYNEVVNLCLNYLNSDIIIKSIHYHCFQILFFLFQNLENEELRQPIVSILMEQYIKLTNINLFGENVYLSLFDSFFGDCSSYIQENDQVKQSSINFLIKIFLQMYNNASEIQKSEKSVDDKFSQWDATVNCELERYVDFCLSLSWKLRKICPELMIEPFTNEIYPLIMQNIEVDFISPLNASLLAYYLSFFEDGNVYEENRQILFNYFNYLIETEEELNNVDDYDDISLVDWKSALNDLFFNSLCRMIKFINFNEELIDDLIEELYALRVNGYFEVVQGDLCSAILLIFRKYPQIVNQDFGLHFEYTDSNLVYRNSTIHYNTLYFDLSISWLENYFELFEQNYKIPNGEDEDRMLESMFKSWIISFRKFKKNDGKLSKLNNIFGRFFNFCRQHPFFFNTLKSSLEKFKSAEDLTEKEVVTFSRYLGYSFKIYKSNISSN